MKKFIKLFTLVFVAFIMTASLAACGTNDGEKAVTGVVLNKSTLSLTVPGTETLTATVSPSDATVKTVTWSSSAPQFATVSSSGLVTAVAAGTATITATSTADNTKAAACTVTVSDASVVAPTAVDVHTDIIDTDSKFMLLSNADEVNAGAVAAFTLAANIGHSVDDAVVKYDGVALTKIDNSVAVYSSVRNAAKLMSIVTMSESEVVYVKPAEVKYVTYELGNVAENFDPNLLTVEEMTKTYKLILFPAVGGYYADVDGTPLHSGLYDYIDNRPRYYVEVPMGKAYELQFIANSGYYVGDTSGIMAFVGDGMDWYVQTGLGEVYIPNGDTGYSGTPYKSFVAEIPPQENLTELEISAGGVMPDASSAEIDMIRAVMGGRPEDALRQNSLVATRTGQYSFEIIVAQKGDLFLDVYPIGKYECSVEIKVGNGIPQSTYEVSGQSYHCYGPINYVGQDIDVILYLTNDGQNFTYTLHITSPKPVQEIATSLIDIQAGSAKYSINNTDFASVAKATSSADLSGVSISGFTASYGTSAALDESHVILTANTACGITLANSKAPINIFIQQSGFYVQDFLWASAADFGDKAERIDVSEKVELTPANGKLSIFYYAFRITLEIVILI